MARRKDQAELRDSMVDPVWMNFWIEQDAKDWLRNEAAERRMSMSSVVREMVMKEIGRISRRRAKG